MKITMNPLKKTMTIARACRLLLLVLFCLPSFAQENVSPLPSHNLYRVGQDVQNQESRNTSLNEGLCDDNIFLHPALITEVKPTATNADGSLKIGAFSNDVSFDYYLNGVLIEQAGGSVITFDNLEAGPYVINVVGASGESCSIFMVLSDQSAPIISDTIFQVIPALCEQGKLDWIPFIFVGEIVTYNVYSADGVYQGDVAPPGIRFINLDPGDYYLQVDYVADSSSALWAFEVPDEIHTRLPFVDDFSDSNIYPSDARWQDDFAYVNQTFAVNPLSLGVATLDGLNDEGLPYVVSSTFETGSADKLTSRPFCFDGLVEEADSLYLSFYYQATGVSEFPNPGGVGNGPDSLLVEMKDSEGEWHIVWERDATDVPETDFELVVLPVQDQDLDSLVTYFEDGFQFRFRTIGALNGLLDPWHIDFVELDTARTFSDTNIEDLTFVNQARSFLKNYQAMPWNQFYDYRDQELQDSLLFEISNLSAFNPELVRGLAEIVEICDSIDLMTFQQASAVTEFNENIGPNELLSRTRPTDVDWSLLEDRESAVLKITQTIGVGSEGTNVPINDTLIRYQIFDNYYAYDDGSAERAYGVYGSGAEVALQFVLNEPDVLQGIQVYFTHVINDVSANEFAIKAWADLDFEDLQGVYDSVIAKRPNLVPLFTGETGAYTTYVFEEPVAVEDTFYVGYEQTLPQILNIGQDLNNNSKQKLWFNTNGLWIPSNFDGAVMIRPILGGDPVEPTGIKEEAELPIHIFPNPASDFLQIQAEGMDLQNLQVAVHDLSGRTIFEESSAPQSINVADWPSGMYLIEFRSEEGVQLGAKRFLKQ